MSDDELCVSDPVVRHETERDRRVRHLRVAAHAADAARTRQAVSYPDRKAEERGQSYRQQVIDTVILSAWVCWAIWASHLLGWWQ